jgi:hypothetical protein
MDFNSIMQSISNMGFPAIVCIIMIWINREQTKSYKEDLKSLKEALDQNTKAVTELRMLLYTETREKGA